jgi:hypothetical protein
MKDDNQVERLTKFLLPIDRDAALDAIAGTTGAIVSMLGKRVKNITLLHVMAGKYLKNHIACKQSKINGRCPLLSNNNDVILIL